MRFIWFVCTSAKGGIVIFFTYQRKRSVSLSIWLVLYVYIIGQSHLVGVCILNKQLALKYPSSLSPIRTCNRRPVTQYSLFWGRCAGGNLTLLESDFDLVRYTQKTRSTSAELVVYFDEHYIRTTLSPYAFSQSLLCICAISTMNIRNIVFESIIGYSIYVCRDDRSSLFC